MSIAKIKQTLRNYENPKFHRLETLDAHTGGEPLRVILSGYPEIKGRTILEKRRYLKENLDHLRTALMFEPRGHADMYGCLLTEPVTEGADFGIIFLHNEGYSSMCGHAIIAISTIMIETGAIKATGNVTKLRIDAPAGLITSYVRGTAGAVESVYFHNVPSYVDSLDNKISVEGLGDVSYDLAFGGAYYAYVDADSLGISMAENNTNQLIDAGMKIKRAVMAAKPIKHPLEADLGFLYGTIFTGKSHSNAAHSRNVCIFAEGEVDRSPTGTGVSGRMAIHHKRGDLALGESMMIESILGSSFKATVHELTKSGDFDAVIPEVEGKAHICGKNTFYIDPQDPLKNGFILR
jgi:trans-L-3-hydroxyproline dehydratase